MTAQPFLQLNNDPWIEVKDGNPTGLSLFHRHYSRKVYADGRDPKLFVGPGQKMVLLTPCARALFVWRKFISGDGQTGVNCSVFRNEGAGLSSDLIRSAMKLVWRRWPNHRLYTYVNPRAITSSNPGYCFKSAGWRSCGITKHNKLLILEYIPVTEFINKSDLEFADISSEAEREYTFPTGQRYRIEHPMQIHVSESGGHRIFDGEYSHYVQPKEGWAIRWRAKDGEPHFVR